MNYEYFIARRYLKSKRRTRLVSFTTFFSFIVIVIGVACITILLSIMNGFESIVIDRFLTVDSHINVIGRGSDQFPDRERFYNILESNSLIEGYSPYVEDKVMLISERENMVVTLKGIDPEKVNSVSEFSNIIVYGSDDFTGADTVQARPGIILGDGVADRLGVLRGELIRVMSFRGVGGYFREPDVRIFEVTGFFRSDIGDYDFLNAYISLEDAQRFFRMGDGITGFNVNAGSLDRVENLAEEIRKASPENVIVNTWYDQHKSLYSSMKLEKIAAFVILSLIILVASFSIACSLIMLVLDKRREIGILKSMGGSERSIKRIFIINGMIIGLIGTLLGLGIGFLLSWLQMRFEFVPLPQDIYIISALPVYIKSFDFIAVGLITVILTLCSTLYPAQKAAGMLPTQALRYE
ncbi:FtsX-like permease family protein [candidate division KSB1 bacterium]